MSGLIDQPVQTDLRIADGVFVKVIDVALKGTAVPQHSHRYDHITMLAWGAMQVWAGNAPMRVLRAPEMMVIPAFTKHTFITLVDHTRFCCIHNVSRALGAAGPEVHEEHQFKGDA